LKRVAIHQPNFLPWIGYFHKISLVDTFVFFDDVQFPRGKTFGNRVKIKTNNGELWLTVPVLSKGDMSDFNETIINNTSAWQRKSIKTIELAYRKAPYFDNYHESFSKVFLEPYANLTDLNISLIKYLSAAIGLETSFELSSQISESKGLTGDEKIIAILKSTGATKYISGQGAGSTRYIDEQRFRNENIELEWQNYVSPVYQQLWGEFIPDLSALDLLFNCGPASRDILEKI